MKILSDFVFGHPDFTTSGAKLANFGKTGRVRPGAKNHALNIINICRDFIFAWSKPSSSQRPKAPITSESRKKRPSTGMSCHVMPCLACTRVPLE